MPHVEANGISLYYDMIGDGPLVLWIQGLGADHTAWLGQTHPLRQSFRSIVFDNRDVGQSQQVTTTYSVADMAEDSAALLSRIGSGPVHVVGLSMGGNIAQELVIRHPELVRTLTLVSSSAGPDARLAHLLTAWADIYEKAGMVDFYRQGLAWLYSYRFFERPRSVQAALRYVAVHPQPADAFRRQVEASLRHNARGRLSTISVPALIVSGEEDILVPQRLARELARDIGGSSLIVVPDAAHAVNIEQAAEFNRVVATFFQNR